MKKSKLSLALCSAMLLVALAAVGCGPKDGGDAKEKDFKSDEYYAAENAKIGAGFTSLENKNANGPVDADGYYSYGGQKFKVKDEYKTTYSTEPTDAKFNYLINQWTYNSYHYTNMVDGLVENDKYSNIVGALAKSYKVKDNADGTQTWTFEIKKGVRWVDNKTGKTYGEVKAEDFVSNLKYVLNPLSGSTTINIVTMFINGAQAYYNSLADDDPSNDKSFDTVGAKATGDYTLEYTISEPAPFFLTALTYSPYLPVCQAYLDEMGTDFGASEDNILVNGAFRITEHTNEAKIVYTKNAKYWDKDHVYVNKVTRTFVPGTSTPSTTREWYESGVIDAFNVSAADETGYAKYVEGEDGTGTQRNPAHEKCNGVLAVGDATYVGYWNFNRGFYEYADNKDNKTDAQKKATAMAILDKDFRLGFLYGMDVLAYTARYNKSEPYSYLARAYTNRELCSYNGKDYVDYVCDVFNEKQGTTGVNLTGLVQQGDPVHDAAKAKAYFAKAKASLKAKGLTDADFPIKIDLIASMQVANQAYEHAMFDALEAASDGVVKLVHNVPGSDEQNTKWGSVQNNYDFSMFSGWGPDYADPNTYLHTYAVGGDSVGYLGFKDETITDTVKTALTAYGKSFTSVADYEKYVLGDYDAKYKAGAKITDVAKLEERYQKFADAEYALIYEEGIIVPWLQQNGYVAVVSNTVAHQAGTASYGLTSDKYKNVVVTDSAITKAQRQAIDAAYNAGKK